MIHQESRETYGRPRLWDALIKQGHGVGEQRVARLMRVEGIRAKTVKKWRATTQSNPWLPVAETTLNRQVTGEPPTRVWTGDSTYVWTTEGWLYLAVILDRYSRLVVGWAMGHRLTVALAEQALTMAPANRNPRAGLLHHSDRGSPYAATRYPLLLTTHGIITSMSRRGHCWDNAGVERFVGTLKRELVYHRHYATREDAKRDIFEYIEVFYHRQRRYATLGYHSPAEYEARTAVAELGVHGIRGRSLPPPSLLWSEEFSEQGEDMRFGGRIDLADAFDQARLVHRSDLIQHDLTRFTFESNRHTGGVGTALGGHGGHDDGVDMVIDFVRRNDEAVAGLADFTALGVVEAHEIDLESGDYQVQFFRSHSGVAGVSRSRSWSSP